MKLNLLLPILAVVACVTAYGQGERPAAGIQNAAASEKGLIKVSIMYPFAEGKPFNMDYYETKHMPMVAAFLGSNLVKYTIEKGVASGIPNQPLPFAAIGSFYVRNLDEYRAAVAPHRDAIRADFANYTSVAPVILISEVVK